MEFSYCWSPIGYMIGLHYRYIKLTTLNGSRTHLASPAICLCNLLHVCDFKFCLNRCAKLKAMCMHAVLM